MTSIKKSVFFVCAGCVVVSGTSLAACSSDSTSDTPIAEPVGVGGTGNAGGAGNGGTSGGSAGQSGSGGASGSGGLAGSGGVGGSSGAAGGGGSAGSAGAGTGGSSGSGGSSDGCLDPSSYASAVTVAIGLPFCVVSAYTTDRSVEFSGASWGSHGGPLTASSSAGTVSICRWQLPTGSTGAATCEKHDATPPNLPAMIFFGTTIDVPYLGGTLLSYTGMGAEAPGEVLLYSSTLDKLNDRANVNGFFSAVPVTSSTAKRLVYTGLSPITAAATTTSDSGLYVAADCAGKLAPTGACAVAKKVASWQTSSGPIAADADGAVFATMSTFGGAQEIHGFAKEILLTSDTPGNGDMVYTDMSYTTSIAAIPPTLTKEEGYAFIAEGDPNGGSAPPIMAVKYSSSDHVVAGATLKNVITQVQAGSSPTLFTDGGGLLWLAVDTSASGGMLIALRHK